MSAFRITKDGEVQHVASLEGCDGWTVEAEFDHLPGKYERVEGGVIVVDMEPAWRELRAARDSRLAASDWSQLPDVPAGVAEAWRPYRQALRDMTDTTTDPRDPAWPKPPAASRAPLSQEN